MAKMTLSKSTYSIIPEGVHTFKVMEVDDTKYEDFGKLTVKLQTAKGETHTESYSFLKNGKDVNEGALKAWSYFARVCLNNPTAEEIDTQDIVGCYITATVKHEKFTRTKGERAGEEGTAVRISDYVTAVGFDKDKEPVTSDDFTEIDDDTDELDDFLND